ncbi:MAG: hypothetical protein FJ225_01690 [Lentisphaerae bacterium]|nr:hypothetical protein [Lentisphaerota bacterium]
MALRFGDNDHYRRYTRECAAWLGWRYEELPGDARLIMNLVEGNWSAGDFLVVEPGRRIVASHDDAIIRAEDVFPPRN